MRTPLTETVMAWIALTATAEISTAAKRQAFDTRYIPREAAAAIVVRPARALQTEVFKKSMAAAERILGKQTAHRPFSEFERDLGNPASNVDEVVVLFTHETVRELTEEFFPRHRGGREGFNVEAEEEPPTDPVVILRLIKPDTTNQILRKFLGSDLASGKKRKHAGKTYYLQADIAACMADPRTFVLCHETIMKQIIDGKPSTGPLAKLLLKTKPTDHGIVAMSADCTAAVRQMIPRDKVPPAIGRLLATATNIRSIVATARIDGKPLVDLQVRTTDVASSARMAAAMRNDLQPLLEGFYKLALRRQLLQEYGPHFEPVVEVIDQLVGNIRIESRDASVVTTIRASARLQQLPKRLQPLLEFAKREQQRAPRKMNLRAIGHAVEEYVAEHKHLPRHGSNHTGKQFGLSWRVHLLPQLGEKQLYKQFKLNEPWDSKHNIKLIAKMPDVFKHPRIKTAGKTAIHVFDGERTPLGGRQPGLKLDAFTIACSETLLAIETGPDKADFWTKPGGIIFDIEENPYDELGKIDEEFLILMLDGTVRTETKSLRPESLRKLIQLARPKSHVKR